MLSDIFSASALPSLPFEDAVVPQHDHVSIMHSNNGPHQTRQMKLIGQCVVHVVLTFGIDPWPTVGPLCTLFSPIDDSVVLT